MAAIAGAANVEDGIHYYDDDDDDGDEDDEEDHCDDDNQSYNVQLDAKHFPENHTHNNGKAIASSSSSSIVIQSSLRRSGSRAMRTSKFVCAEKKSRKGK